MEYVNATQISPLISKVQIKVCYVGQKANRNGTVITKETAIKLANGLPGCPIVGDYNEEKKDFESHSREVVIEGGKYKLVDMTKPYGFVDIGASVWFQKFNDDGVEHEYLCTEGYLWTKIYKESQRVVDQGNNQSMELNEEYEKGFWSKDDNSGQRIFIINDGLIEKLCILGSEVEPCFEGAQITSFSLNNPEFVEFKNTMFSMINELKDALNKGGPEKTMENEQIVETQVNEEPVVEEYEKKEKEEEKKEQEDKKEETKDNTPEEDKEDKDKEEDKKKEKKYELSDIAEYVALQLQYNELQNNYSALKQEKNELDEEVKTLRAFKLAANRKEKEDMIASFYMLSDEDKKDVVDHIDTYSLNEIEAKLSILCVRNKVNFNLEEDKSTKNYTLNLGQQNIDSDNDTPEWVKAVKAKG